MLVKVRCPACEGKGYLPEGTFPPPGLGDLAGWALIPGMFWGIGGALSAAIITFYNRTPFLYGGLLIAAIFGAAGVVLGIFGMFWFLALVKFMRQAAAYIAHLISMSVIAGLLAFLIGAFIVSRTVTIAQDWDTVIMCGGISSSFGILAMLAALKTIARIS